MTTPPRVSLIIPVYNVAGYVGPCLRSVAAQTMPDFEAFVIDDGATDGSGAEARAAVAGDARFTIISQPNAGLSAARNTGLDRATAPYIAFVDSDDRIAPTYLERLLEAIEESGADWVSCGISFERGGQVLARHSAIHDPKAWRLRKGDAPERHDFSDWREVVRHFPSAWNKLYRREILGDLRFDPGMLYEDHAFYWRYAARSDHLLRLPEPLYRSTQGRAGQITRDGSDAVFQQLDVLDILETVSAQSDKPGRRDALARIASRLIFERSEAVRDADRWARFTAAGQAWMAQRDLPLDRSLGVPQWWQDALEGRVSVSVIVPSDGQAAPLQATLDSLAEQRCRSLELLVVLDAAVTGAPRAALEAQAQAVGAKVLDKVLDGVRGLSAARAHGLAAARGDAVVFLDAGDRLGPGVLGGWHNRLIEAGAQMGFAPMRMGRRIGPDSDPKGTLHSGLHGTRALTTAELESDTGFAPRPGHALAIHAHPSAKIFDRETLQACLPQMPEGPLDMTHVLARLCARAARIVRLEAPAWVETGPGCRTKWRAPTPAADLRAALQAMQDDPDLRLPEGWETRLWARLVWEKLNHAEYGDGQDGFEADLARLSEGLREIGTAGLDPYIGPRVRKLIGLPEAPEPR